MYITRVAIAIVLWVIASIAYAQSLANVPSVSRAHKIAYLSAVQSVWGLNAPAWLASQIEAESGWRDGQLSSASAQGICQFIPATAKAMEEKYIGLSSRDRFSPEWCYYAQALLMRDLYRVYRNGREPCEGIKFSSAGYNGAPSTLNKEIALCEFDMDCDASKWDENVAVKRSRAVQYWQENRRYVQRIKARESVYVADNWGASYCGN